MLYTLKTKKKLNYNFKVIKPKNTTNIKNITCDFKVVNEKTKNLNIYVFTHVKKKKKLSCKIFITKITHSSFLI